MYNERGTHGHHTCHLGRSKKTEGLLSSLVCSVILPTVGPSLQGIGKPLVYSDFEPVSYQSLPLARPQAMSQPLRNPAAVSGSSEPSFLNTLLILADAVCSLPWRATFYTYFLGHIYLCTIYNVKSYNDKVCGCPKR